MYFVLFVSSSAEAHLGCFRFLAFMSNSVLNVLCGKTQGCFFKAPPNNSNVQSGLWAIVLDDDKWQNYFSLDWQLFALSSALSVT